jgi:hypothetical protein
MQSFKLYYKNPGEDTWNHFGDYDTLPEATKEAETPWEDDTQVQVLKVVKDGFAKSVVEWH